jgi:hypothetical protein
MIDFTHRVCIPGRLSRRGEGLGNEIIPWAKAFLASRALNISLRRKSWGLNRRGYRSLFGSSPFDWIIERSEMALWPNVIFGESEYLKTGIIEYGAAIKSWSDSINLLERKRFVLVTPGMFGGYLSIRSARTFIRQQMLMARDVVENAHELQERCRGGGPLIAVHIRIGDFSSPVDGRMKRSSFNNTIPIEWYRKVCTGISKRFGESARFMLFSDTWSKEVLSLRDALRAETTVNQRHSVCSDLISMSSADCLVCSISSFSMAAAFLGDSPYVWYAPQLGVQDGFYSIWGHETTQQHEFSATNRHRRMATADPGGEAPPRCAAIGFGDDMPESLLQAIGDRVERRNAWNDLIYYGVLPATSAVQECKS